jgi:hypothetical protein
MASLFKNELYKDKLHIFFKAIDPDLLALLVARVLKNCIFISIF